VHNEKHLPIRVPKKLNRYPEKVIIQDKNKFFLIETAVDEYGGFKFSPPTDGEYQIEFVYSDYTIGA
jgi:hypothetical protein